MHIQQSKSGNWYILDIPSQQFRWAGPYNTKQEAADDMRGLKRFYGRGRERRGRTVYES